jgi:hypothetical protein
MNNAINRSRTFEYTIDVANTWEYKTITIPGDVSGVWLTNNSRGLLLYLSTMCGTNFAQVAGSWGTGNVVGTTNQVNWLDTLGATFYITGVQLEVGNQATSFEHKSVTENLTACRRYYEKTYPVGVTPGTVTTTQMLYQYVQNGGTGAPITSWFYKTAKRTSPTITLYNPNSGAAGTWRRTDAVDQTMSLINNYENIATFQSGTAMPAGVANFGHAVADSELA